LHRTLFHVPHSFFDLGLGLGFSFGWLLIGWVVFGVALMVYLVRRNGWTADTRSYLPVLVIIALAMVFLLPMLEEVKDGVVLGLPIRGYGVMVLLGAVSAVGVAVYRGRRMGLDPEVIYSLAFWVFLAGILGARLFFVIEYWNEQFRRPTLWETVKAVFSVTEGGLVVYGSFVGALIAAVVYLRRRKLPLLAMGDLVVPSMMLGLAFGRVGCLLNGCCYGGICEDTWAPAMEFPRDSPPFESQLSLGALHGFRLTRSRDAAPIVIQVDENRPAAAAGLRVGDELRSIKLPAYAAFYAAIDTPQFTGRSVAITTSDGRIVELTIGPAPTFSTKDWSERLGMRIERNPDGRTVVKEVTPDGPADEAGLHENDVIEAVRLPPIETSGEAQRVLSYARGPVAIETADGRPLNWTIGELPRHSRLVHPTQIYSSINAALLFLLLWNYYPFRRRDGELLALLLVTYPPMRFLLEILRDDEPGQFQTALTNAQWMSFVLVGLGILLWVYVLRQPRGVRVPLSGDPRAGSVSDGSRRSPHEPEA
jgi:phosphatidylglycerol:prolipoprotein diacylglycerol transferase